MTRENRKKKLEAPEISSNSEELFLKLKKLHHDIKRPYIATVTFFELLEFNKDDKEFLRKAKENLLETYENILKELEEL